MMPPSIAIVWPVTFCACSEHSHATARPMSCIVCSRPSGTEAAHRRLEGRARLRVAAAERRTEVLPHLRVDEAGRDRIDADALGSELQRARLAVGNYASLGGRVGGEEGARQLPRDRGGVADRRAGLHARRDLARHDMHGVQVQIDVAAKDLDGFPFALASVLEPGALAAAGVVA